MAVDIGPKIGIDGEKEYRSQINNIITQAKTLSSEMKEVTSSFDKNTSAEEKARKTSEVLTKQIKVQQERVDLLKDMLEKSKQATGENSNETLKWQQAVNNANAELNTMRNKLNDVNSGLEEQSEKMDGVADHTDKASDNALSFGDIVKANVISDAIIKGFDMLKDAVSGIASAFKDMTIETVKYADDLATLSTVTGLSTDTLQEFQYMTGLADVSVETITGSMTKMTKQMSSAQSGSKSASESFKSLGINVTEADGSLRKTEDVFYDVITALGEMNNEAELDATAMAIFGKSAKELKPLIDIGTEGIEAFRKEAKEMGYVLNEEQLDALLKASDAYDRWNNMVTTIKNNIGVGLAPALETMLTSMQKWASSIDWKTVGEQIGGVFERLTEAIANVDIGELLNNIVDGVMGFVDVVSNFDFKGFFESVQGIMDFISKYGGVVAGAIGGIGAVIGGLKIANLVTSIGALAPAIGAMAGPIGIAIGAITAIVLVIKNWGKITETVKKVWEKAKESISKIFTNMKDKITGTVTKIKDGITNTFNKAKDTLVNIGESIKTAISNKFTQMKDKVTSTVQGIKDAIADKFNKAKDTLSNIVTNIKNKVSETFGGMKDEVSSTTETLRGNVTSSFTNTFNDINSGITSNGPTVGKTMANALGNDSTGVIARISPLKDRTKQFGKDLTDKIKDGSVEKAPSVGDKLKTALTDPKTGVINSLSSIKNDGHSWGADLIENMKKGMESKSGILRNASKKVADIIHSYLGFSEPETGPLSNFHTYMPDMMKLMAQGIDDNSYLVESAVNNLASKMSPQTSVDYGGVTINMNVPQGANGRELVDQIEQELATRMLRRKAVF